MSNWLADRLGIHVNLRPLAAIAGGVAGNAIMPGLGGMAMGSGLARLLDGLGNGENIGQSVKAGAMTGGLTYGGGKALGALRSAFAPSSSAAGPVGSEIGQGLPSASGGGSGGMPPITAANLPQFPQPPMSGQGGSFLDSLGSGARSVGSFMKDNPNAIGMGFQGLGSMAGASSQNALHRAEAEQMAQQTRLLQQEEEAKRARSLAMEPLLRALMGSQGHIAPNPYGVS